MTLKIYVYFINYIKVSGRNSTPNSVRDFVIQGSIVFFILSYRSKRLELCNHYVTFTLD